MGLLRHLVRSSIAYVALTGFVAPVWGIQPEHAAHDLETAYEVPTFNTSLQAELAEQGAWQSFRSVTPGWSARFNEVNGRVFQAYGPGIPMVGANATLADYETASRTFIDARETLFGVGSNHLRTLEAETFDRDTTFVVMQQYVGDLPVEGSVVQLRYRGADLISFRSELKGDGSVPDFALTADDAATIAFNTAASAHPIAVTGDVERAVFPKRVGNGYELRPVWVTYVETSDPIARFKTLVDAVTGEVLSRRNTIYYAAVQLAAEVEARTVGDPLVKVALPHTSAGITTDADGVGDYTGTSLTAQVAGTLFNLNNQAGADATRDFTLSGVQPIEQLFWTAAGSPIEQLDAYYYALKINEAGRFHTPGLGWLNSNMPVNVNINDTCNAFFDGSSINFFVAGNGCNNTARIYDVVAHEWGHGFHFNRSVQGINAPEIQEGVADYIAASSTNDSTIGPRFLTNGGAVRDVEPNRVYPQDFSGSPNDVHSDGLIWGGAWWDLRKAMIDKYGYSEGVYITDQLHSNTILAAPRVTTGYTDALLADDNDGNTGNGTPNSCEINATFGAHGLIDGTPVPQSGYVRFDFSALGRPYPENFAIEVTANVTSGSAACGALDTKSVMLNYTTDLGQSFTALPMTQGAGNEFTATIPGQLAGTFVQFYFSGTTEGSTIEWTSPRGAPYSLHATTVGDSTQIAYYDFEADDQGWTHESISGGLDDQWQRGNPNGKAWDPTEAASGTNVFGTDLGALGNGIYPDFSETVLRSPQLNCSSCGNTKLIFARWLNVAQNDTAQVLVNGNVVWDSQGQEIHDQQWVLMQIDISDYADGNSQVQAEFKLITDGSGGFGGWNLDDVEFVAGGASAGSALDGGCTCTLGTQRSSWPTGGSALAVLALLGGVAVLRRRRA